MRSFLARGGVTWFGLRFALVLPPLGVWLFSVPMSAFLLVVVGVAVRVDQRVRREHLMLSNAGVHPLRGPLTAMAMAAALETLTQLLTRSVAGG